MTKFSFGSGVVIVALLATSAWWLTLQLEQPDQFAPLSSALADAHISENVWVNGKPFEFRDGALTSKTSSDEERFAVLRTAYALTVARQTPLFGLAGTDPDMLLAHVEDLAATQQALSETQEIPDAAAAIASLYPLSFLRELATLEKERQTFLASGADTDMERYHAQLTATIDAYTHDVAAFKAAFDMVVGEHDTSVTGLNGTMTAQKQRQALARIEESAGRARRTHEDHIACLAGQLIECDTDRLHLPQLSGAYEEEAPQILPPLATEIAEIIRASRLPTTSSTSSPAILVAPSVDTCLQPFEPPHYLRVFGADDTSPLLLGYGNDLLLSPTKNSNEPAMRRLSDQGVSYALINPLSNHLCPELSSLIGGVRATVAVATFAEKHPSIAPAESARLLEVAGVLHENNARRYVDAALDAVRNTNAVTEHELMELALMLSEKSAGLEFLLERMAQASKRNLAGAQEDSAPSSLYAKDQFLSRSMFPSLLLAHHPSVSVPLQLFERTDASTTPEYVRYSELRDTVSREKIISDLKAFFIFEGLLSR